MDSSHEIQSAQCTVQKKKYDKINFLHLFSYHEESKILKIYTKFQSAETKMFNNLSHLFVMII